MANASGARTGACGLPSPGVLPCPARPPRSTPGRWRGQPRPRHHTAGCGADGGADGCAHYHCLPRILPWHRRRTHSYTDGDACRGPDMDTHGQRPHAIAAPASVPDRRAAGVSTAARATPTVVFTAAPSMVSILPPPTACDTALCQQRCRPRSGVGCRPRRPRLPQVTRPRCPTATPASKTGAVRTPDAGAYCLSDRDTDGDANCNTDRSVPTATPTAAPPAAPTAIPTAGPSDNCAHGSTTARSTAAPTVPLTTDPTAALSYLPQCPLPS